jgi:outer membrane protein OmpA-like peptidoglycan-associated protein
MRMARTRPGQLVVLALVAGALLGGCATQPRPAPRTTVVLMPDEDGKVGAVTVSSTSGTQALNGGFTYTVVDAANATPSAASAVDRDALNREYGALIRLQQPMPKTFTLYFLLDKTELTEESKAMLPTVFAAVRERQPIGVTVFGHADATGSPARNLKLSADRAEAAAGLLRTNDPSLKDIELQFFGETQPLAQTGPGVPEARNRRVEILIR